MNTANVSAFQFFWWLIVDGSVQWFSNFNVQTKLLGILLKFRFWLSRSEVGPDTYISYKLPISASAADLWTALWVARVKQDTLECQYSKWLEMLQQRLTIQPSRILIFRQGWVRWPPSWSAVDNLCSMQEYLVCFENLYKVMSIYRHIWSLKLLISDQFLPRGDSLVIESTDFRVTEVDSNSTSIT